MIQAQIITPLGPVQLTSSEVGVRSILFLSKPIEAGEIPDTLESSATQLQEYFSGTRKAFDMPLDLEGTEFQRKVWAELLKIPFGATMTYLELATMLGEPKLVRAVGAANGKNPVGIVVPCHRVIGTGGKLVGYAGGLERKRWLLHHERALSQPEGTLL